MRINKNSIIPLLCVLLSGALSVSLHGAPSIDKYPQDTINGMVFYRYPVEKSIGLYRISVNFGVSQDEILKYNPEVKTNGLRYGETILLIPVKDKNGNYIKVLGVTRKTTAVKSKTDFEGRKKKKSPPRKEHEIILDDAEQPMNNAGESPKTQPKTNKPISETTDTAKVEMRKDNVRKTNKPLKKEPETTSVEETNTTDRVAPLNVTRNIALLLPLLTNSQNQKDNVFLDFYDGVLLGLKQIGSESLKFNLYVYDIGRGQHRLDSLIEVNALDAMDAILGPVYTNQVTRISEWTKQMAVPVFIPFADNVYGLRDNPYLYQFNFSDTDRNAKVLRYLMNNIDSVHCLFLTEEDTPLPQPIDALRKKAYANYISFTDITTQQIFNDSLTQYLLQDKNNIIIFNTDKYKSVQDLIPIIKRGAENYKLTILGEYSWRDKDIDLPMLYCSVFTDKFKPYQADYEKSYRKYFGAVRGDKTVRYDLLGYDMIREIVKILNGVNYQPLQSEIKFVQVKEDGGYKNKGIYLLIKE